MTESRIERRFIAIASAMWLLGCAGAGHAEQRPGVPAAVEPPAPEEARSAAPAEADSPPEPQAASQQTRPTLEALEAALQAPDPRYARTPRPIGAAVGACPDPAEGDCDIAEAAGFDPSTRSFIVLELDHSESGPEDAWLLRALPARDESIGGASFEAASVRALRRATRQYRRLPLLPELVTARAETEFSMNTYAPLVALGGPLDGWLLFIDTTDLDTNQYVLELVHRGDGRRIELARRPAIDGPCDGDGYWCERTDSECDAEGLRAEGRLCIEPLGIDHVALAGDGLLLVRGVRQVAGHGGYPPFHWVVELPPELRSSRAH